MSWLVSWFHAVELVGDGTDAETEPACRDDDGGPDAIHRGPWQSATDPALIGLFVGSPTNA